MCGCSENESGGGGFKTQIASAAPGMKPLVPISRQVRVDADALGTDQSIGTIPTIPVIPCKLDFREGCYQISYKPTGSLVTFHGTLRVDRSAPDGGTDNLIVSGDLYSVLPGISSNTSNSMLAPVGDREDDLQLDQLVGQEPHRPGLAAVRRLRAG